MGSPHLRSDSLFNQPHASWLSTSSRVNDLLCGVTEEPLDMSTEDMARKMSVSPYDVPDKLYRIMSLLWTSDRVFRDQNGAPITTLRVRWRSAGSHIIDTFAYWKEEFKEFEEKREPPQPNREGE